MKNKTKMDINIQRELLKITTKKIKLNFIIISFLLILVGFFIYKDSAEQGLGFILTGAIMIIIFGFFWNKILMRQYKNNKILGNETYNYYEFSEDNIIVNSTRDEENIGQSILKYTDIVKVVENKKFVVLFISNVTAFVVSKANMTEGKIEDLIAFLKLKIDKYKIVK